jgi:hypothetical protein
VVFQSLCIFVRKGQDPGTFCRAGNAGWPYSWYAPFHTAKEYHMNLEDSLEDEIAFWQTLIERQADDTSVEVVERMAQARQLAERKLLLAGAECLNRNN